MGRFDHTMPDGEVCQHPYGIVHRRILDLSWRLRRFLPRLSSQSGSAYYSLLQIGNIWRALEASLSAFLHCSAFKECLFACHASVLFAAGLAQSAALALGSCARGGDGALIGAVVSSVHFCYSWWISHRCYFRRAWSQRDTCYTSTVACFLK